MSMYKHRYVLCIVQVNDRMTYYYKLSLVQAKLTKKHSFGQKMVETSTDIKGSKHPKGNKYISL